MPTADLSVPPDPPADLRARVISATAIELLWEPSGGATEYRVEWDMGTEGQARALRASTVEPLFRDEGLWPGAYRYWVYAKGPGGTSEPAAIAVYVPLDALPAPPAVPLEPE